MTPSPQVPNRVRQLSIGRNPQGDIILDRKAISWDHAMLVQDSHGQILIQDLGSTNGTFLNSTTNRVQSAPIRKGDTIYFGDLPVGAERLIAAIEREGNNFSVGAGGTTSTFRIAGHHVVIGRAENAGHRLDHPTVSWQHARISRNGVRFFIEDLGSTNGTFIDGVRVTGKMEVLPGQLIWLGAYTFRLNTAGEVEKRDTANDLRIEARNLEIAVPMQNGGRTSPMSGISLVIEPGELVALMSVNGAGKSTGAGSAAKALLDILSGANKRPLRGQVLYGGIPLETNRAYFRSRTGYVPRENGIHPQLTAWEALFYTARLRLPPGTSEAEIRDRVDRTLSMVGLFEPAPNAGGTPVQHRRSRSGSGLVLNGAERKLVNIAQELLFDPSVIFLDDPAHRLSHPEAKLLFDRLRTLASKGKAIVLTVTEPDAEAYRQFHNLAVVEYDTKDSPGGLLYFGPAEQSFEFFLCPALETIPIAAARQPPAYWRKKFEASSFHLLYVERRLAGSTEPAASTLAATTGAQVARPSLALGPQLATLTARMWRVRWRDPLRLAMLTLAPVAFAFGISMLRPAGSANDPAGWDNFASRLGTIHFLLALAAACFGLMNGLGEIAGERGIFERERKSNLSSVAYLSSKLLVLAGVALVQTVLLFAIAYPLCGLAGNAAAQWFTLFLTTLTVTAISLFVSAIARTIAGATLSLPLVLLPMIVLGGGVLPLSVLREKAPALRILADLAVPVRWAFEANMHFENDERKRFGHQRPAGSPPSESSNQPRPDFAERAFPISDGRHQPSQCLAVLAGMLTFWTVGSLASLRIPRHASVKGGR